MYAISQLSGRGPSSSFSSSLGAVALGDCPSSLGASAGPSAGLICGGRSPEASVLLSSCSLDSEGKTAGWVRGVDRLQRGKDSQGGRGGGLEKYEEVWSQGGDGTAREETNEAILRKKEAVMPHFELWQGVKMSQREKWEDGSYRECALPRRQLVQASGEATNENRGFKDNLWEGKARVSDLLRSQRLLCSIDSLSCTGQPTFCPSTGTRLLLSWEQQSRFSLKPQWWKWSSRPIPADRNQLKNIPGAPFRRGLENICIQMDCFPW